MVEYHEDSFMSSTIPVAQFTDTKGMKNLPINFLNRVIVNNLSNPFSRENADILRGGDFVWIRAKSYDF